MSQISKSQIEIIHRIKNLVRTTRTRAMLKANAEMINLYFRIGGELVADIEANHGKVNIVKQTSKELVAEFGVGAGYGERNLKYMIKFFKEARDNSQVHQLGALLPWKHTCYILDRYKTIEERIFYLKETLDKGFKRDTLIFQIENNLYERSKLDKTHNFELTLPENSNLAQEIVKSEYVLVLTGTRDYQKEKDLERGIL